MSPRGRVGPGGRTPSRSQIPDLVGIELGRASGRWGSYRPRSFDCEAGSLPTMTTFTEAPLQSRKVEFLDSGFRLGFPRKAFPRRAKLKCSLAFTPTHSGLPLDSSLKSMAPPAFRR